MDVIVSMNNKNDKSNMSNIKLLDSSDVIVVGDEDKENNENKKNKENKIKGFRFIKLKEDIYYGPKNINKNRFVRIYKKLGLSWIEGENINGVNVDGWFSKDRSDRSQYVVKLPEEGGYKRFKFLGCDDIYSYFMSLGAVAFELSSTDSVAVASKKGSDVEDEYDSYRFVGADLWAGYRTRQLLKGMPMDWGVIWK